MEEAKRQEDDGINEGNYPSVETAYDLVMRSYEWLPKRAELKDAILVRLITWEAAIALAFITYCLSLDGITTDSHFFRVAILMIAISMTVGFWSLFTGTLQFPSPPRIWASHLHREPWDFKRWHVRQAESTFVHNKKTIERKADGAKYALVLFVVALVCFGLWIVEQSPNV